MIVHDVTITGRRWAWVPFCTCGWHHEEYSAATHQQAELWKTQHLYDVKFVRLNKGPKSMSVKSQWKYYDEQANDRNNTTIDRRLWRQLADELKHYVLDDPHYQQAELFKLKPPKPKEYRHE